MTLVRQCGERCPPTGGHCSTQFYLLRTRMDGWARGRDGPCWLTSFTIIIKVNKKKFCIILLFAHKPYEQRCTFGIAISKSKQIKSVSLMVALVHAHTVRFPSITCERSGKQQHINSNTQHHLRSSCWRAGFGIGCDFVICLSAWSNSKKKEQKEEI